MKNKYKRMYFLINKAERSPEVGESQRIEFQDLSLVQFDLDRFDPAQIKNIVQAFINFHQPDIQQDILRIKKDKMSCQWLVPDPILNAP